MKTNVNNTHANISNAEVQMRNTLAHIRYEAKRSLTESMLDLAMKLAKKSASENEVDSAFLKAYFYRGNVNIAFVLKRARIYMKLAKNQLCRAN